MKISKKSLHYKLTSECWDIQESISLCKYFWMFILSIFLYTPIKINKLFNKIYENLLFTIFTVILLIGSPIFVFLYNYNVITLEKYIFLYIFIYIISVIIVSFEVIVLIFLLFALLIEIINYIYCLKAINLFYEYIKAKKNKICPILKFDDGDKDEGKKYEE